MSAMHEPEPLIHQQSRLYIMSALAALPVDDNLDFVSLKKLTSLTDGNLSVHLSVLKQAGYVVMDKGYEGKKPITRIRLSPHGHKAFLIYVETLEKILNGSLTDNGVPSPDEIAARSLPHPAPAQHNPFPATG